MLRREKSAALFAQAQRCMPGGVNSPVRSFANVQEVPVFVRSAYGSHVEDEDGNVFIDYIGPRASFPPCKKHWRRGPVMVCLQRQRQRWPGR